MTRLLRAAALLSVAWCTACSGGSSSPAPAPTATPTLVPTPAASATPTASPSPSPSPTASPSPVAVSASPASITFGSNAPVALVVTQTGYSGTFVESDTCAPLSGIIATVTPKPGTKGAGYDVTPEGVGTCTITITGEGGSSAAVPVVVSAAAITVQ